MERDMRMPDRANEESDALPLAGARCLVLDDDLLIALDIEQLLRGAGASMVACVGNVADALAALQHETPFTVAVLDIALGGDDSVAVPALLQQRNIPFVFLTGMGDDDPRALRYPDAPVVDKPYRLDELLAALRRALRPR